MHKRTGQGGGLKTSRAGALGLKTKGAGVERRGGATRQDGTQLDKLFTRANAANKTARLAKQSIR